MGSWRGFVIPGRSQPNSLKMKVLLVLAVAAAVSAHSGEDYKMFMKWAKGKAMESCWGEDNMKLLTLNMKKAVSKCMQEDAPVLDLPPFRYMNSRSAATTRTTTTSATTLMKQESTGTTLIIR